MSVSQPAGPEVWRRDALERDLARAGRRRVEPARAAPAAARGMERRVIAFPRFRRETAIAALAAVVFLCQSVTMIATLPLWQAPDEPQSVGLIQIFASGTDVERQERYSPRLEAEIVSSMDRWGWWPHVGVERPTPIPPSFDYTPFLSGVTNRGFASEVPLYHWTASHVIRLMGVDALDSRVYVARVLSAVGVALAVFFMIRALLLVASGPWAAMAGIAVIVFHPQLVLASAGATPDGFATLVAAAGLMTAIPLLAGRLTFARVATLSVLVVVGMLTKRTTIVLAYYLAMPLLASVRRVVARRHVIIALAGVAALLTAVMVLAPAEWARVFGKFIQPVERLQNLWASTAWREPAYLTEWFQGLFISFWQRFGWMRYGLSSVWYVPFGVLTAVAVLGGLAGIRADRIWARVAPRRLALFALGAVLFQITAVFGFYGLIGIHAQGRYLLPVLPLVAMLVAGFVAWLPAALRPAVALSVAAFLVAASLSSIAAVAAVYY